MAKMTKKEKQKYKEIYCDFIATVKDLGLQHIEDGFVAGNPVEMIIMMAEVLERQYRKDTGDVS